MKRIIPFLFLLILLIVFAGYRKQDSPLPPAFKSSTNSPEIREVVSTDTFKVLEAEIERYRKSSEIMKQHEEEIQRGARYNKIVSGNPEIKAVAITFDDGPHPYYTPRLLAILKKYGVKATFFVVGKMAQRYPGLLKAEVADSHCIASHSYTHPNLTRISIEQMKEECRKSREMIKSIVGIDVKYCRPPGGDYDSTVMKISEEEGLTMVLWTDDPGDYASPGTDIIEERTLDCIHNGAIILLHDGVRQTLNALPIIIESLRKRGFAFQTIDEMVKMKKSKTLAENEKKASIR